MSLQDACQILDVGRQRIYQLSTGDAPDIKTKRIKGFRHYSRVDIYRIFMDRQQRINKDVETIRLEDVEMLFNIKFILNHIQLNDNKEVAVATMKDVLWKMNSFLTSTAQTIGLPQYYLETFVLEQALVLQSCKSQEQGQQVFQSLEGQLVAHCHDEKLEQAINHYELLFIIMCLEQDLSVHNDDLVGISHFLTHSIELVIQQATIDMTEFINGLLQLVSEIIMITTNIKEGGLAYEY